jgi:uncharacterized protein
MKTPTNDSSTLRRQLFRWWGWLLTLTLLLALVIAQRYFDVSQSDASPGVWLFRLLMLTAHFTTLAALFLIPVLLIAAVWPQPRGVVPIGIATAAALLIALLIDTQVYQLYRFHINAGVLNLLFGGAASETFIFPPEMYLQASLIAGAMLVIVVLLGSLCWRIVVCRPPRKSLSRMSFGALAALVLGFHSSHIVADLVAYEPLLEQTQVLPLRYAATAKRFMRAMGMGVRERPHSILVARSDRSSVSYPLAPLQCAATKRSPNILVVMIDSWRFDAMNAAITPNIAQFSQRSVRFSDHYSGGNATRIGVFSFFYSIPGTYWHSVLIEKQGPVFIDELLKRHYDVQVFRSAPLQSPEFHRTVFAHLEQPRMRSDGADPAEWDRDLTDDFLRFLESRAVDKPFFGFLFYDAPHNSVLASNHPLVFEPSAPAVNYLALDNQTDKTALVNRYWNSLNYVDSLVGEVLLSLEQRSLLDNTIVIITGDHGQEFNDNGRNYWGHSSNFSRYQTSVPFLLYAPAIEPGVLTHRTTHFDVVPTLLSRYFGCTSAPTTYSVGRSLFDAGGRETLVFSEYSDFAIAQDDRIAVVRKHGMTVHGRDYVELSGGLDASAVRTALEQKTRFYQGASKTRAK